STVLLRLSKRGVAVAALGLLATAPLARAQEEQRARAFLRAAVGYSDAQIAAVDAGQVVTRSLPSSDKPQIAAFGAVRLGGPSAPFVQRMRDGSLLHRGPSILEKGQFSRPPKVEDLAGLTLEDGDFKAARECAPGHCDIKMSRDAMDRLRREIDWSAPDARARTTDLMRLMLVDHVAAYMQGGASAMAVYVDKERPLDTSAEFRRLLAESPYLVAYVPDFHRYLSEFPSATLPGAVDSFNWTKDKFGPKPTLTIHHDTFWTDPAAPGRAILASKQIYASHFFQSARELLALPSAR